MMKHTRITGLLALVLVVVMMLTLVGCGDKSDDSGDKTAGSKKTTVTTTTTTTTTTTANGSEGGSDEPTGSTDTTGSDTTGSEPTGSTNTTADDPFKTTATTTGTKKPTTTTTSASSAIPTGTDSIFKKVPEKLKGQKIKIMIWWTVSTDDRNEADLFKEQTGISVATETATMDKYQSNLSSKIMAGNPPQIAAIISEWYPQPITRGLMQPISVTGWDFSNKKDDIYALGLMDQFSYKGEHYGIALKGSNMPTYEVMFFNKDFLAAKGVKEDPYQLWKKGQWNWDTCLNIAKACTDAKKEQYGLTCISQFYWMLSAGQDFVLSDLDGLKNNIKSSKLLEAWNYAWDMIYTHKVIPTNFSQQKELFYSEQVAMFATGSYFMQSEASHNNYVPQNCKFDWGVVPFPSPPAVSAVAACEGTVFGFPTKIKGDALQAAMWYLRYYLDDTHYGERDMYPKEECWEVMGWMSSQKVQSYNSVGVVCYGGKYNAWSIQYSVIDEATTKAQVKTNLDKWYAEIDANIETIVNEI